MTTPSTPKVQAYFQGQITNTLAVMRTELRDAVQGVAAITRGHEARLPTLLTRHWLTDTTPFRRDNFTPKRDTKSLPV